jgi:hypothetical protein
MLSPELMGIVANENHGLARDANRHHLPMRMAEVKSASSGGKNGVGNASAVPLWGADHSYTLAEQGAAGLNFHGGFRCSGYTPICTSQGHYSTQPLYYGMMLFHATTPGRVVPVSVHTSANVFAHGVLLDNGTLRLLFINKDGLDGVKVEVPGLASYSHAPVLRLVAPTLDSQAGITFGGRAVSAVGSWEAEPVHRVERNEGSLVIQ